MNIKKLIADLRVCADEDILCTACDRYHEMKEKGGSADCVNKLLLDAAEALEKMPQWIPVTERLPGHFGTFLVAIDEAHGENRTSVDAADFDPLEKRWSTFNYFCAGYRITHWMPLPEPPNEDSL